ncbi:HAD family hydrolase [Oceaniglobus roseus]|uniref:HAD family hydrolase n=1 Tax=Oceaniglobus roseus TaxID=1737570 RepID=UPI000C7F3EA4|nr:HAD-IA family hydrolase [Kandeliimicrobium roseum]
MAAALLFDLDGTLLHSDPIHIQVFIDLMAEYGRKIDADFYLSHIHGRANADIFADFLPGEDAQALSDRKEAMFRDRLGDQAHPTEGLTDLLDRAARNGWRMAVVTNAPRVNADAMLAAIGMQGRFDTLVIGEECARGKPDPLPYRTALDLLGLPAERAIAFEDSPSGIRAARGAGLYTYGLTSSLDRDALAKAGASASIDDFTDPALDAHLTRLEGAIQ